MTGTPQISPPRRSARRWRNYLWLLLALIVIALAGIGLGTMFLAERSKPHDLQLKSVSMVREIIATRRAAGRDIYTYENMLRINMTSRIDIESYALRYRLNVWVDASPCAGNGVDMEKRLWDWFDVFGGLRDELGPVTVWSVIPGGRPYRTNPSGPRLPDGEIVYHTFISTRLTPTPSAIRIDPKLYAYDLTRNPVPVCLVVRGAGNFWAGGFSDFPSFSSNTVTVPQQKLQEAIARANFQ